MDKPKTTSSSTSGHREETYWEFVERTAAKVDNYPAWKLGGRADDVKRSPSGSQRSGEKKLAR